MTLPPYNIFPKARISLSQSQHCRGGEWQKLNKTLKSRFLARVERLSCLADSISKVSQGLLARIVLLIVPRPRVLHRYFRGDENACISTRVDHVSKIHVTRLAISRQVSETGSDINT